MSPAPTCGIKGYEKNVANGPVLHRFILNHLVSKEDHPKEFFIQPGKYFPIGLERAFLSMAQIPRRIRSDGQSRSSGFAAGMKMLLAFFSSSPSGEMASPDVPWFPVPQNLPYYGC
jgi:hypothetical protein